MAKILVIDDDEHVVKLLTLWLLRAGYEVESACEGERGMRLLEQGPVDLVITDIIMPGKEGLETITAIRKINKTLPIISMSGGGSSDPRLYLNMASAFGANYSLQKPFDRELFLTIVQKCLAGIKREAEEQKA